MNKIKLLFLFTLYKTGALRLKPERNETKLVYQYRNSLVNIDVASHRATIV